MKRKIEENNFEEILMNKKLSFSDKMMTIKNMNVDELYDKLYDKLYAYNTYFFI